MQQTLINSVEKAQFSMSSLTIDGLVLQCVITHRY